MVRDMWHVTGRGEVHTELWWGNLNEKANLEDLGVEGRIILEMNLNKICCDGVEWIELPLDRENWRALL